MFAAGGECHEKINRRALPRAQRRRTPRPTAYEITQRLTTNESIVSGILGLMPSGANHKCSNLFEEDFKMRPCHFHLLDMDFGKSIEKLIEARQRHLGMSQRGRGRAAFAAMHVAGTPLGSNRRLGLKESSHRAAPWASTRPPPRPDSCPLAPL